jgi:hypothetical protein
MHNFAPSVSSRLPMARHVGRDPATRWVGVVVWLGRHSE